MTADLLNEAISDAFIRSYFDLLLNIHPNGEMKQFRSLIHCYIVFIRSVRIEPPCFKYLPSVRVFRKQKNRHLAQNQECLFYLLRIILYNTANIEKTF